MSKSQFNIKISKDLLTRVKRQAMREGKSLTEHITELINKSLSGNDKHIGLEENNLINDLYIRIISLESIVKNREYISPISKPFTDSEAVNCSKFMRTFFDQEVERKYSDDKEKAFNDFLLQVNKFFELNKFFTDRLEEVILGDNSLPFKGKELNIISQNAKCNCPIRKGLIMWSGKKDCPSQQEICDKGENLLAS